MKQFVFTRGGENQDYTPSKDTEYLYNTLVLEISNNWPFARWLMYRVHNNLVKEVDLIERDWLNFILQNKIDLEKYGKDSDKFLEDWLKKKN